MLELLQNGFLRRTAPWVISLPFLVLIFSCSDRAPRPASLPPDPPPALGDTSTESAATPEKKGTEFMELWTAPNGQRRIEFSAEAAQHSDYWSWDKSDGLTFRVTAEMHEYKQTPDGERARRLGGKANVLIFDPAGRKLVHEAYQLIDLCPT